MNKLENDFAYIRIIEILRQLNSSVPSLQWYSLRSQRCHNSIHVPSPQVHCDELQPVGDGLDVGTLQKTIELIHCTCRLGNRFLAQPIV